MMKKCEYCGKEISYSEMFCSSNCEEAYADYYKLRSKFRIPINFVYIMGTLAMGVGIFLYPLLPAAACFTVAGGAIAMGILTLLVPSPPEEMIKKHKIKEGIKKLKIFGIILGVIGIAPLVLAFLHLFLW